MATDPASRFKRLEISLGVAALVLLLIGCFLVMRPFLSAAMWAVVLCITLWPVQNRLTRWFRGRRTLAAVVTTVGMMLVLVVPFIVIGVSLADDARALGTAARRWVESGPPPAPAWLEKVPLVGRQATAYWADLAADATRLRQQLRPAAGDTAPTDQPPVANSKAAGLVKSVMAWVRAWLPAAGLAVVNGIFQVFLSVLLAFLILREGGAVGDRLVTVVGRIAGERGGQLITVAINTLRGVVYGILGTAVVQGVLAGIGYLIAGVPGAALLGLLTFFLSVVPVGPPLIWIPATLWLFSQGATGWGIFMLVWGIGVSSVDNIVKPWLISQGSDLPFILIFCGVLGGVFAFGFLGVFLGPTLLAVAYRLIEEWLGGKPAGASGDS